MGRVLFVNGHVWQSRQQQQMQPASWLLISRPEEGSRGTSGEVLAVGVGDPPRDGREDCDVIDLAGAVVLPGLQDAHIHIGSMGESACYVELSACRSVVEVQQTIRQHAESNPDLPWVIGTGWDQNLWSPPVCLTRGDLDAALPSNRPCLLYRRCWHSIAVNSAAMRAAGIDPDKKWAPPLQPQGVGAQVERKEAGEREGKGSESAKGQVEGVDLDEAQRPTGLFKEDSMRIVESAVSKPSFETRCEQFAEALGRCVRSGLTAVHSNDDDDAVEVYARLQDEGRLPLRVYLTMPHEELENVATLKKKDSSDSDVTVQLENVATLKKKDSDSDVTVQLENVATLKKKDSSDSDVTTVQKDKNSDVSVDGDMSARNEPRHGDDNAAALKGPDVGVEGGGEEKAHQAKPRPGDVGEGLVSRHRVKLFSDGSLGAETAAMRVPYVGTDNTGTLNHEPASLTRKVAQARDKGFRVEVHAIGDRALSSVLDAFEGAGITAVDRPIVTHCQVAGPDLVKRMEKLGAVAAVQPSFVPSDAAVVIKRLSPSVHASCYPWRTLLHAGVTCAGSSDAPIETHDPLRGIYDAVYRPNKPPPPPPPPPSESQPSPPLAPEAGSEATAVHATTALAATTAAATSETKDNAAENSRKGHGAEIRRGDDGGVVEETERGVIPFLPDERLTLEEAVWMYTTGGAIAAGVEDRLGAIRPGSLADLTILRVEGGGAALLKNPSLIVEAKVSQVWVGGSCRWNAATDSPKAEKDVEGKATMHGSLSGSGFPGKNGPKRKRASGRDNPWLTAGSRRIGRCRCCS